MVDGVEKMQPFDIATLMTPEQAAATLYCIESTVDSNRDGAIDASDTLYGETPLAATENPFRWWINDDRDSDETNGSGDTPGQSNGNGQDNSINGLRDLIDFFPFSLKLSGILSDLQYHEYTLKLRHADQALKFFEAPETITRDNVGDLHRNPEIAASLASKALQTVTASGTELSPAFLEAAKNGEPPVLYFEATQATQAPLEIVLDFNQGQSELVLYQLPLSIDGVEKMYRSVNLRGGSSATGEPSNLPDTLGNGKSIAFLHGYNITEDKARGWNAEFFKRLYQLGNRANFIGITWPGDVAPDYHKAVYQAFVESTEIANALSFVSGELTIAAHSLGNMVVSNAIENHGFSPNRYKPIFRDRLIIY